MKRSVFDHQFQQQSIESKIVVSLERISEAFRVLLWKESKEHALSPIQVQILIFCNFHSEQLRKISSLASEFNLTKATVSDSVKALEQKGFIRKQQEPEDTRSYTIHLTKEGAELAKKISMFADHLYQPLSTLSDIQKQTLLSSLLEMIYKLQQAGIISINRMCFSCRYYQKKSDKHYCNLMNTPLKNTELRIDCPEHEMIGN